MKIILLIAIVLSYSCSTEQVKPTPMQANVVDFAKEVELLKEKEPFIFIDLVKYGDIFSYNKKILELSHINKNNTADNLKAYLVENYISELDSKKMFFTKKDVNYFKQKYTFEHILETNGILFVYEVMNVHKNRVSAYADFIKKLELQSIDSDLSITLFNNKYVTPIEKTMDELKIKWANVFRYDVLNTIVTDKITVSSKIQTVIEEKKIKTQNAMNVLAANTVADHYETFIDSFSKIYDIHTDYFSPIQAQEFNADIKGQVEGIGGELDWSDSFDFLKITDIIPSGGLSKEKNIKIGDVILQVTEMSSNTVIDLKGLGPVKSRNYFVGKTGTKIKLKIKHVDGTIKNYTLTRSLIASEKSFAQSLILEKNNKRIGYIYLPKFYRDFSNSLARNCTNDIIKIVKKLKKQNISSLILDLRSNGGGSLLDAQLISGLFIKEGPIVQMKDSNQEVALLNDIDPNSLYDGPLVVLVNKGSASASEIVSAALQDYNRAIIVGGEHTHGKGTVQMLLNFRDQFRQYIGENSLTESMGTLKFSMQKFYRISGKTTQYEGITPDIIFPDVASPFGLYEKELPFSLPSDTIEPLEFNLVQNNYNKNDILTLSKNRTKINKNITKLDSNINLLKKIKNKHTIKLNTETIKEFSNNIDALTKQIEETPEILDITFKNTDYFNPKLLGSLKKDLMLEESVNISLDLIKH